MCFVNWQFDWNFLKIHSLIVALHVHPPINPTKQGSRCLTASPLRGRQPNSSCVWLMQSKTIQNIIRSFCCLVPRRPLRFITRHSRLPLCEKRSAWGGGWYDSTSQGTISMQFWPKLLCSKLFESGNSRNNDIKMAGFCDSFWQTYSCTNLGELNRKDLYEGLLD